MHRIAWPLAVLAVIVLPAVSRAQEAASVLDKGAVDLTAREPFARPFTLLDQLLYSLEREARDNAKHFRPEKDDFYFSERVRLGPSIRVSYDRTSQRVAVEVDATVSAMDDPWRPVCERHVRGFAENIRVARRGDDESMARWFFARHLGPGAHQLNAASLRPFLDAVVVTASFYVESRERGKALAYLRQCFLDNKTGRVSFREHRY